MSSLKKIPIHREDDGELLGLIVQDGANWKAQTIFGYTLARTDTQNEAEMVVREQGLSSLMGTWQYFDTDDEQWYPCILKEANEHKVTVIRTNYMGHQDPDDYKLVTINDPDETKLIKA